MLLAQDQLPSIKVDVDLVSILTSVRDKRGALIPTLQKEDFTILEDGKPQPIKYFTKETDLPLTIGLLVDVSGSQRNLIDIERSAASQFFREVLRKKDLAFLISFGEETELLQDYTGSPRLLTEGLGQLRASSGVSGIHPGPVPTIGGPRGTVLYDAIYLAANEKLKGEVGRKVIVVITDGVDQGSRLSRNQAIEAAQKSDAVIYSIDYSDPHAYGPFGIGRRRRRRTPQDERRNRRTSLQGGSQALPRTTSSKNCRTKCAASTQSPTPPPTKSRTAATATWRSAWRTRI